MLGKKGLALILILAVGAVYLAGHARSRLDRIVLPLRESFQDFVYLPRGNTLKILACGFDSPLADALYIKGLVYFSQEVLRQSTDSQRRVQGRKYVYELFDVITDLSPRFTRAYQMGSILTSSSPTLESAEQSVRLLQKGVDVYDDLEAKGEKVYVDPRWLLHLLQATTYETKIAARYSAAGDIDKKEEAIQMAGQQFRLAGTSPYAPDYVINAAVGYQATLYGGDLLAGSRAMLGVWYELHKEAIRRGDKSLAAELEKRAEETEKDLQNILDTQRLETEISQAGQRFLAEKGRLPEDPDELVRTGYLASVPAELPLAVETIPDKLLRLPDGSFRSQSLAEILKRNQERYLQNALLLYRRANKGKPAPDLATLVREKYIGAIPTPPLAALGQTFEYNAKIGAVRAKLPEGETEKPREEGAAKK